MQQSKLIIILLIIGFVVVIHSCEKDLPLPQVDTRDTSSYQPTPYELDLPGTFPQMEMPDDNPLTKEGVRLGRFLFYDPILSMDSSLSCSGCHAQADAFSDAPNAFSDIVSGGKTDRNSPAIINTGWIDDLFWDGRAATLEAQHLEALNKEMKANWPVITDRLERSDRYKPMFHKAFPNETISKELVTKAIAQFVRTLISGNSKFDKYLRNEATLTAAEARGYNLFFTETGDCFHCHGNPLMTDNQFRNNGLDSANTYQDFDDPGLGAVTGDTNDYGKFKTPTLRNVEFTPPYMHDGRFSTLQEVMDFYSSGVQPSPTVDPLMRPSEGGLQLTAQQKSDLIAFMKALSDTSFVNDNKISDPFN